MPLTNPVKAWYTKNLPGMNNLVENLDLQDKWVEIAQNCRFEEDLGAVDKREPVTYYNSSSVGSGGILGLYRFYSTTGNIKFFMVHGTKAYIGDDVTGSWTEIRDNLTEGRRMAFETYKNLCIMSNGYDNMFVSDGSSDNVTWELGACKAVLGSGAGNLDASADYYYSVTFDNDAVVNGAVSNVVTTDGSNQQIELSNIPLGPLGTVNRKIYRTEGDGSALKLVTTIADNVTTTYTDNVGDGSLTTAYPAVTDDMPKGSILQVHRERLFVAGDPVSPSKIYYSNTYLPHYIQQTTNLDYMEVSPEDGDEIMGIPIQYGGIMVCIKKNTIRRLHISSPTSGADPNTWYAEDPIAWVGSPAQWSISQTPYGIMFLGWDHWYSFNGSTITPIIDEFDVKEILPSAFSDTVATYHKGVFIAAYSDATIAPQSHNRIMRFNLRREALSFDLWTSTTLTGANCFAIRGGDDENGELFYGDSANGYVIKDIVAENVYRMRTKTECNEGSKTNIFVGGRENTPYIEIGATTAATAIPQNICMLWDSVDSPGTGWDEVTGFDERILKIDSGTVGTTDDGVGVSGSTYTTETVKYLRLFKKNASTTEYQFPEGAITIWDQSTAPAGWINLGYTDAYIGIDSALGDDSEIIIGSGSGDGSAENLENKLSCYLIKRLGEEDTWDGLNQYAYALYYAASAPGNGWTDVTTTYDGYYLYGKSSGEPETSDGAAAESSVDYVQSGVHYETATAGPITPSVDPDYTGEEEEGYDRSDSTFREAEYHHPGDGTADGTLQHQHEWDVPSSIDSVYVKMRQGTYGGNYKSSEREFKVELKVDGAWEEVDSQTTTDSQGSNGWAYETYTLTDSTGWDNVTGMRVYMYGRSYSYEGDRQQFVKLQIYNVQALGKHKSVSVRLAKKILGQMNDYNTAITSTYTSGTWVAPAQQINAETLKKLFWNELITDRDNDDIKFYTRTGATESACTAASWSTALSDPNGSTIASSANVWFQYKIEFSAADTTDSNPRVYFADGFVVKYNYDRGQITAETSVNWQYSIGFRNLNTPMQDKNFIKLQTVHEGEDGSFNVEWETEHANDTFTIDLSTFPEMWDSYFHDTAYGRQVNLTFSKNDLNPFRLSEIKGAYQEHRAVI